MLVEVEGASAHAKRVPVLAKPLTEVTLSTNVALCFKDSPHHQKQVFGGLKEFQKDRKDESPVAWARLYLHNIQQDAFS